jgi:hypothetical protein
MPYFDPRKLQRMLAQHQVLSKKIRHRIYAPKDLGLSGPKAKNPVSVLKSGSNLNTSVPIPIAISIPIRG